MHRLIAVVEGHGEVEAVPVLLRRLAAAIAPQQAVEVLRPIRVRRSNLLKEGELERTVELAARQTDASDAILVLVDADDDCPAELGTILRGRASVARPDRRTYVVLAKREYEAWFLAAAESLAGRRGLASPLAAPDAPEAIRGAKEWLRRNCQGQRYRETLDQAALTAVFDLQQAQQRSPSFAKLWRDVSAALAPPDREGEPA